VVKAADSRSICRGWKSAGPCGRAGSNPVPGATIS